jgi:hypothetical protein
MVSERIPRRANPHALTPQGGYSFTLELGKTLKPKAAITLANPGNRQLYNGRALKDARATSLTSEDHQS